MPRYGSREGHFLRFRSAEQYLRSETRTYGAEFFLRSSPPQRSEEPLLRLQRGLGGRFRRGASLRYGGRDREGHSAAKRGVFCVYSVCLTTPVDTPTARDDLYMYVKWIPEKQLKLQQHKLIKANLFIIIMVATSYPL